MSYNALDLTVLKNIITSKKHALDFASNCDARLFTPEVWNFANVVVSYIRNNKELPTLRVITEKLSKGSNEKLVSSIKNVWAELDKVVIDENEYKHDLDKIKHRFAEKQILGAKDFLSKVEPGSMDVDKAVVDLQKTIQSIKALDNSKTYENKNIKEYLPAFVEKFNARKNNPEAHSGLMTGYSFLDYATNGLKPADFVIVSGESGFGKSLLLQNMAIQVWLQDNKIDFSGDRTIDVSKLTCGKDIVYFSLEMPYEDCFNRLLSRLSGVPSRKIENADLSKEEFAKIKACLDFIKEYPYQFKIVDIPDACANDLEAVISEGGEHFDTVFIDYLGIMKPNDAKDEEQDWLKQGIISFQVRGIGRKLGIPIFSAVQLNRKSLGKESSENIGLSRLARSATIATHATHVIQIENRPQEEKYPDFIYWLIKNRKGPKGKGTLIKDLICATLLDKKDEPAEGGESPTYDDIFKEQDDISEEVEDLEL